MPTETIKAADGVELALSIHPGLEDGPVVLILHGLFSHQGWYREIAQKLSERGINACLMDRRGCGRSMGTRGHMDSWRTPIDDVVSALKSLKQRFPGCSTGLVGISLGGVISLATSILHPTLVDRQVLFCPGLASTVKVSFRRRLRLLRRALTQPKKPYDLPFGIDELTDRPEWRAILQADPLRTRAVSARFLVEMFRMQRFVATNMQKLRCPVFCMLAGEDAIIDNARVSRILNRGRPAGVTIETFEGSHHVLHASIPGEQLAARISAWMLGEGKTPMGQNLHTETQTFFLPGEPMPQPPSLT